MITSEELAQKFAARNQSASASNSALLQRGTFKPAPITSSTTTDEPPVSTPATSPLRKVTRIISKKLPPPPRYVPHDSQIASKTPTTTTEPASSNSDYPSFVVQQDTIPRSLAFKLMRWMRIGQDVIHIEEDEDLLHAEVAKTTEVPNQDGLIVTDDTLLSLLNTSTVQADGEIEHAAVREAAASTRDVPLEEVVAETKTRWRSFGRRAVAKTVLPLIEYSAIAALKSFKDKDFELSSPLENEATQEYDPEAIEMTVDSLIKDEKQSRHITKKSMLRQGNAGKSTRQASKLSELDDRKRYIDNIKKLYGVAEDRAKEMVHAALMAAKSDPKGPKIVELHKNSDDAEEVFGVKIQVEGGPAISFAPSDIHARLKPYFQL